MSWRKKKKSKLPVVFHLMWQSPRTHISCKQHHSEVFSLSSSQITSLCNLNSGSGDLLHSNIDSALSSQDRVHHLLDTGASRRRHMFHPAALRTVISEDMKQPMISMARQLSFILPVITSVAITIDTAESKLGR